MFHTFLPLLFYILFGLLSFIMISFVILSAILVISYSSLLPANVRFSTLSCYVLPVIIIMVCSNLAVQSRRSPSTIVYSELCE